MARFAVIFPAAGSSSRLRGFDLKKPFLKLRGIPVWQRAMARFRDRDDVAQLLLVIAAADRKFFETEFGDAPDGITLVAGGDSRAESVRNALACLEADIDFVAVHDAARPLVTPDEITAVFRAAEESGAAIPVVSVVSTIKEVGDNDRVVRTVDRSRLRLAQTPQVFSRKLLERAFLAAGDELHKFTDDAAVVEAVGHPVSVVDGRAENIKLTTAADFRLAEWLLAEQ